MTSVTLKGPILILAWEQMCLRATHSYEFILFSFNELFCHVSCLDYTASVTVEWACNSGGITLRGYSRSTRRKRNFPFATLPTKHSTRTVLEVNLGLLGNIPSVLILVSRPIHLKIWRWQKLTRLLNERGESRVFKRENAVVKFQCYVIRGNKTTSAAKLIKHSLSSPP